MRSTRKEFTSTVLLICFAVMIPNGLRVKNSIYIDTTWRYEYRNIDNENFVVNTGNRFSGRNFKVYYIGNQAEDTVDKSAWNYTWGSEFVENTDVGSSLSLASLSDKTVLSLYARKPYKSIHNDITAKYYDNQNNMIREIKAGCDDHQLYMVFTDGTEIPNISYIEFFGTDGSPISLMPNFYIGVVGDNNASR